MQGENSTLTACRHLSPSIQRGLFMIDVPNIMYPSGNLLIRPLLLALFLLPVSLLRIFGREFTKRCLTYLGGQQQPSDLIAAWRDGEGVVSLQRLSSPLYKAATSAQPEMTRAGKQSSRSDCIRWQQRSWCLLSYKSFSLTSSFKHRYFWASVCILPFREKQRVSCGKR